MSLKTWPTIPDPGSDPIQHVTVLQGLKNIVEMITGQRGGSPAPTARLYKEKIMPGGPGSSIPIQQLKDGDIWINLSNYNTQSYWNPTTLSWIPILQQSGSWVPVDASGAGLTFASKAGSYTRIGNMVFAQADVSYPTTANAALNKIGGLPFTCANTGQAQQGFISYSTALTAARLYTGATTTWCSAVDTGGTSLTNATMSGQRIVFTAAYPLS